MNTRVRDELRRELLSRGFAAGGTSPNNTMVIDDAFLDGIEITSLFETMVARREKVFRSGDVVGLDVATKTYDDVVLAIDAIKVVIAKLLLP
jgi:hypothetical protein